MKKVKKTPVDSLDDLGLNKKFIRKLGKALLAQIKDLPEQDESAFVEDAVDYELWLISQKFKTNASLPITIKMHIAIAITLGARWRMYANEHDQPLDVISFEPKQKTVYIEVTVKPVQQAILKKLHSKNSKYKNR